MTQSNNLRFKVTVVDRAFVRSIGIEKQWYLWKKLSYLDRTLWIDLDVDLFEEYY